MTQKNVDISPKIIMDSVLFILELQQFKGYDSWMVPTFHYRAIDFLSSYFRIYTILASSFRLFTIVLSCFRCLDLYVCRYGPNGTPY